MTRVGEDRVGVAVEEYGDSEVFISVNGLRRHDNQAETHMSLAHARLLAIKILQTCERQERHMAMIAARKPKKQELRKSLVKGQR